MFSLGGPFSHEVLFTIMIHQHSLGYFLLIVDMRFDFNNCLYFEFLVKRKCSKYNSIIICFVSLCQANTETSHLIVYDADKF